jgi:uncharacterized lipoprotein YddW (UPF0748 family)
VARGGKLLRNDWRRENVNLFVHSVYQSIKAEKPWVKFGISPFGIWRPGAPAQIKGLDSYDTLYSDSRKWLTNGWVDYLAPQLYWPVDQYAQSFPVLLKWWSDQNVQHRHLWPGMKVNGWKHLQSSDAEEMIKEINVTRQQAGATGNILWPASPVMRNKGGVATALLKDVYTEPALVPASPWLNSIPPLRPELTVKQKRDEIKLTWKTPATTPWQWLLQKKVGDAWTTEILPGTTLDQSLKASTNESALQMVLLSAVDRFGNIGLPAVSKLSQQ